MPTDILKLPAAAPLPAPSLPPHILHVADRDFHARFGRMFWQVALGLTDAGLRLSLITDDEDLAASLESTPVECHWTAGLTGWRAWMLRMELAERVQPLPVLVHAWGTSSLPLIRSWTRRTRIPVLLHALSQEDVNRLSHLAPRPHEFASAGCALFQEMLRRHWPAGHVARVLRPALFVNEDAETRANSRLGSADPQSERTLGVLWAGRVEEHAGLDVLVDAVARLRTKSADVQIALIGDGPGVAWLWRRIRQRAVPDCVSLISDATLWNRAVGGADVLVVPTRQSDLALAPLLAMALRKVVLAAREQPADWFVEGETCWQFASGASEDLATLLARVVDDAAAARQLGASAAAYVRQRHAMSHLSDDLVATYTELLAAQGALGQPAATGGTTGGAR